MENLIALLRTASQPVSFFATGNSMLPTIRPGSQIRVRPLLFSEDVNDGEIVAFSRGPRIVCHRVLFAFQLGQRKYVYEKGDNNYLGRFLPIKNVIGKVVAIDGNDSIPGLTENLSPAKLMMRRCTDWILKSFRFLSGRT